MLKNFLLKLRVMYARHQLATALLREEEARLDVVGLRTVTIPMLERALKRAELDYLCADAYSKAVKAQNEN